MDKDFVLKLRDVAYRKILADQTLAKQWHDAKDEHARELLMSWVIFEHSFDQGYQDGYNDGAVEYYGLSDSVDIIS